MEIREFTESAQRFRQYFVEKARSYLHSDEDTEDAVQEMLIKLWAVREKIDPPEKFKAYGSVAVKHVCMNLIKAQRKTSLVSIDNQPVRSLSTPQSQMEDRETREWLEGVIERMPFKYRELLRMRNVEKLSYEEIAQLMGTTEGAVRTTICRARTMMMEKIKQRNKQQAI